MELKLRAVFAPGSPQGRAARALTTDRLALDADGLRAVHSPLTSTPFPFAHPAAKIKAVLVFSTWWRHWGPGVNW